MANPLNYFIQDPDAMKYELMRAQAEGMAGGGAVRGYAGGSKVYGSEVPDATPTPEQMREALAERSWLDTLGGAGEVGLNFLTGAVAQPAAGIAGALGETLGLGRGEDIAGRVAGALTYAPTTAAGQMMSQDFADLMVKSGVASLPPVVSGFNPAALRVNPGAGRYAAGQAVEAARPLHEAYMAGEVPGAVNPASYAVDQSKRRLFGLRDKPKEIDLQPAESMPLANVENTPEVSGSLEKVANVIANKPMTRRGLFETAGNVAVSRAGRGLLGNVVENLIQPAAEKLIKKPAYFKDLDMLGNQELYSIEDPTVASKTWAATWNKGIKPNIEKSLPSMSKAEISEMDSLVKRLETHGDDYTEASSILGQVEDLMRQHHNPELGDMNVGKEFFKAQTEGLTPQEKLAAMRDLATDHWAVNLNLNDKQLLAYMKDRGLLEKGDYKAPKKEKPVSRGEIYDDKRALQHILDTADLPLEEIEFIKSKGSWDDPKKRAMSILAYNHNVRGSHLNRWVHDWYDGIDPDYTLNKARGGAVKTPPIVSPVDFTYNLDEMRHALVRQR